MRNRLHLLIQTPFLTALALLLINDHYLKAAFPSCLTGKLSDFAGLFVFAVFAYALLGGYLKSKRRLIYLHLVIAALFILWKITPVEIILNKIGLATGLPIPTRIKDITDLMALAILPVSFQYISANVNTRRLPRNSKLKEAVASAVLLIAGFAIVATVKINKVEFVPQNRFVISRPLAQSLAQIEQVFAQQGYVIDRRNISGDSLFIYVLSDTSWHSTGIDFFEADVVFKYERQKNELTVSGIKARCYYTGKQDDQLQRDLEEALLGPLREAFDE